MKRTVLCTLLLAAAAAAAIDWREVASVRVPEGEAVSVAVDGETVWKRVPYDAEIEYIEAAGTQWINTGLVVTPTMRMDVDMAVTDWDATTYSFTGAGGIRFAFGKGWSGSSTGSGNAGMLYFGLGAQNLASSKTLPPLKGVRHIYSLDAATATAWLDNTSFVLSSAGTISTGDRPIMIFAQSTNASGAVRGQQAAKLYGAVFTDNGIVVRDFIPVRIDTTGYLYDRVSGQLFGNMGTGAFVLGPDKE